jgi:hypothetical protein
LPFPILPFIFFGFMCASYTVSKRILGLLRTFWTFNKKNAA